MEAAMQLPAPAVGQGHDLARRPPAPAARAAAAPEGLAPREDLVRVFAADPDLLRGLDPSATELLRRRAAVPKVWVDAGPWQPSLDAEGMSGCFGFLVLEGLMIRSLEVEERTCPELIGAGDLLRPWDHVEESCVPSQSSWTALERTSLAVLDERFAAVVARWPTIMSGLLSRTVQRSRSLAFHLAIVHVRHAETRLRMLLWHLADRWGKVTPNGVHLPLALTHELLAHLVCMRRPTASTALQRMTRAGELERRADGTWLLTGDPPLAAATA